MKKRDFMHKRHTGLKYWTQGSWVKYGIPKPVCHIPLFVNLHTTYGKVTYMPSEDSSFVSSGPEGRTMAVG